MTSPSDEGIVLVHFVRRGVIVGLQARFPDATWPLRMMHHAPTDAELEAIADRQERLRILRLEREILDIMEVPRG